MRTALVFVALVGSLAAAGARADLLPPHTFCPEGHVLRVPPQPGWETHAKADLVQPEIAFTPSGVERPITLMGLTATGSTHRRDAPASEAGARRALDALVDLRNAFGGGIDSEPMVLRHPEHPSASAHEWANGSHLYTVVFDPGGPYVAHYAAVLAVQGRAATERELGALKRLVASVQVDVTRRCDFSSGELSFRAVTEQPPAAAAVAEDAAPVAPGGFDLGEATRGCWTLQKLLQGAYCNSREVAGQPAIVVRLEGDDPLPKLIDDLARTIASPYCREARTHAEGAPPLLFEMDPEGKTFRAWDCRTMQLAPAPPSRLSSAAASASPRSRTGAGSAPPRGTASPRS